MWIPFFPGSCREGEEWSTTFHQSHPDNKHFQINPEDPFFSKNISVTFTRHWNFSWSLHCWKTTKGERFYSSKCHEHFVVDTGAIEDVIITIIIFIRDIVEHFMLMNFFKYIFNSNLVLVRSVDTSRKPGSFQTAVNKK